MYMYRVQYCIVCKSTYVLQEAHVTSSINVCNNYTRQYQVKKLILIYVSHERAFIRLHSLQRSLK